MANWKFSQEGGVDGSGNPGRRRGSEPKNSSLGVTFNFNFAMGNLVVFQFIVDKFFKYFTLKIPRWIYKSFKQFYLGCFHFIIRAL